MRFNVIAHRQLFRSQGQSLGMEHAQIAAVLLDVLPHGDPQRVELEAALQTAPLGFLRLLSEAHDPITAR